jgi:hypothetical protein
VSDNARAVKNYNATSSLCSAFRKQKYFLLFRLNALAYCNACVVVDNCEAVCLAPGTDVMIFEILLPKNLAKILAFLTQNKAKF